MGNERFEIKEEHLKLLKMFSVGWSDCEFGAPEIDPKRPYGNSNVEQDIIEILGLKEIKEGIYEFNLFGEKWLLKGEDKYNLYLEGADEEKLLDKLVELHKETEKALQICLTTQRFDVGVYESDGYSDDWKKVSPTTPSKNNECDVCGLKTDNLVDVFALLCPACRKKHTDMVLIKRIGQLKEMSKK